jgi:trimeric autotransporter adhesin
MRCAPTSAPTGVEAIGLIGASMGGGVVGGAFRGGRGTFQARGLRCGARRVVVGGLLALAGTAMVVSLVLSGASVAHRAGRAGRARQAAARDSWVLLPLAARAAVSRGLGFDEQAFWATRTNSGAFVLGDHPEGVRATFTGGRVALSGTHGVRLGLSGLAIGRGGELSGVRFGAGSQRRNRVVFSSTGVSEWFASGPLGIEQGFTVARRPTGGGPLVISQRLSGNVRGLVQSGGQGLTFSSRAGSLRYEQLVVSGADGRRVPARLGIAGHRLTITITDRGAHYPLHVDPVFQETAELTASDGATEEYLGYPSVAISGSTIVAAGDYHAVGGHVAQGAIYVYSEPASGGWANATQTAELTASDGVAGDYLGYDGVAVSGSTIVADATDHAVGGHTHQGALYVWTMPAGGWSTASSPMTQTAELTASDGAADDYLGNDSALLFSGSTIVTGSYAHDTNRGALYVWTMPAGGWSTASFPMTQTAELTASDGAAANYLGYDGLAMSGSTIVAGAYAHEVSGHADQGAVYVWTMPTGGWSTASFPMTQTAELTASNGAADDYLAYTDSGLAVAISGSTIAAPAVDHEVGGHLDQGAVYVWTMPTAGWSTASFPMTQTAELTASDGAEDDALGYDSSIAISGSTIATAAVYHDSYQGAVYAWTMPASGWSAASFPMTQTAELTASDGATDDYLGYPAIDFSGSMIVAPAPYHKVGANADQGAAYVWTMPTGGWASATQTAELTASDGAAGEYLGYETPIMSSGSTIVVDGGYHAVGSNSEQGGVYVFRAPVTSSTVGLTLSPASIAATGTSTSTATFTVDDASDAPVSGQTVTITSNGNQTVSPVTAGSTPGSYEATITSTTTAGTATITASDTSVAPNATATATLTQTATAPPPPPSSPPSAPRIRLTKYSVSTKRHTANFTFRATGDSTRNECALVKAHSAKHHKTPKPSYTTCRSPKSYKKLKAGRYEFYVKAIGPGGSSKSATHGFKIR